MHANYTFSWSHSNVTYACNHDRDNSPKSLPADKIQPVNHVYQYFTRNYLSKQSSWCLFVPISILFIYLYNFFFLKRLIDHKKKKNWHCMKKRATWTFFKTSPYAFHWKTHNIWVWKSTRMNNDRIFVLGRLTDPLKLVDVGIWSRCVFISCILFSLEGFIARSWSGSNTHFWSCLTGMQSRKKLNNS